MFIVLQVRDHQTGEAVNVLDLECYAATAKIDTPFWKTTVPAGSKLFLTPAAAVNLLAAGSIVPIPPEVCIPWRDGQEAQAVTRWTNKYRGGNGPRFME